MKVFVRRFVAIALFLALLILVGTVGYVVIEGWGIGDSVYMTAITLTAVGYSEVFPLSPAGRQFTMVLLAGGLTWLGLWFALLTSLIVEMDLTHVFRRRRVMREVGKMEGHIIVCGTGRTGRQVVLELEGHDAPWVALEQDPARIEELYALIPDAYVFEGDATHDQLLLDAGLENAKGLITCLSKDTDNLFVCLSARDLNPQVTIVARAREEETVDKLYRAGATHVVSPNVSGAVRMASVLLRPTVVSFLDIATQSSGLRLRLEQASIDEDSRIAGKTLAEARIPQSTGLIVIALHKSTAADDDFQFNPVADTRIETGDKLIVMGRDEQLRKLQEYLSR